MIAGIDKEMMGMRGVISDLSRDLELFSRHATWENVAIVKRREGSSKEGILQKLKEAKSLLIAVKSAYTSAKASTLQLSSTDPLQVRSLKLQLQEERKGDWQRVDRSGECTAKRYDARSASQLIKIDAIAQVLVQAMRRLWSWKSIGKLAMNGD